MYTIRITRQFILLLTAAVDFRHFLREKPKVTGSWPVTRNAGRHVLNYVVVCTIVTGGNITLPADILIHFQDTSRNVGKRLPLLRA